MGQMSEGDYLVGIDICDLERYHPHKVSDL
jgi:hypothetical protein